MIITKYTNGNANITLEDSGTRTIEYEDSLKLDYPLNIDIRVSTKCAFGYNPNTKKAFCNFCHESARTDGLDCDYPSLAEKLEELPKGIELAIGANELTFKLWEFLIWCKAKRFICNLTINQGHIARDLRQIKNAIDFNLIKGLGISYRSGLKFNIPEQLLDYPNTVFHVISGIDTIQEISDLAEKGVKKILILGEKDFGFNQGNVDLTAQKHKEWFWKVSTLFDKFKVVSFDNLALQQLNIKRFFQNEDWNTFNQGEYSFYINAVEQYFAPSSRSADRTDWNNISIKDYFKQVIK